MADIEEAIGKAEKLTRTFQGYLSYDATVQGLVSRCVKDLSGICELLLKPTTENIEEALSKTIACKESLSAYAGYAPDIISRLDSLVSQLSKLLKH